MKTKSILIAMIMLSMLLINSCSEKKNPVAPVPSVTGVVVTPNQVEVTKGETQQFRAEVRGNNNPPQTVEWSVTGGGFGTSIDNTSGLLTVGADEIAQSLTITAISTFDTNYSGGATVNTVSIYIDRDIFVVDISQETDDWDYLIAGRDGSSILFSVDEDTNIPTHLYLSPDTDSDTGMTKTFKENGLPDKMVSNDHILYFGNFNGYRFDMAIIYPNNTIEYHYNIETDINWDAYDAMYRNGRWGIREILTVIKHGVGLGTCIGGAFYPPALGWCAKYVAGLVIENAANIIFGGSSGGFLGDFGQVLANILGCASDFENPLTWVACLQGLYNSAHLLTYLDFNFLQLKINEINEVIRVIDGDGMTIIPHDLLAQLLALGIEINHGNTPPNIQGTFLVAPNQWVRSNFYDSYAPTVNFADEEIFFSNQNNARLTVDLETSYPDIPSAGSVGMDAYITGSGNMFTVFAVSDGTTQYGDPYKSVEIFSGQISTSGIINYNNAFIVTQTAYGIIDRGQGRLFRDGDGLASRTQGQTGTRITIDMYDRLGDGWDHSGALRISVNGSYISNARLSSGSTGTYTFYANPGSLVNIYFTGNTGNYHNEDAFVVYYHSTPPSPAFTPADWSGSNALVYRTYYSLSNEDLEQLLGSFVVTGAVASPSPKGIYSDIHASGK